jgi:hypothetical protein
MTLYEAIDLFKDHQKDNAKEKPGKAAAIYCEAWRRCLATPPSMRSPLRPFVSFSSF